MTVLRTPDDRFENLPGFPFEPHYTEIVDADLWARDTAKELIA